MIANYDLHHEKRQIQRHIISLVKKKKLITLGGPNLISYLDMYPQKVKKVEVWENNRQVMIQQMAQLGSITNREIIYRFGDIINAPVDKSAFYDLDFCKTIKTTHHYLTRFKDCAFSVTFANRFCSVRETISTLLDAVGERVIYNVPHPQFNLLKTNKNEYLYAHHVDSTQMTTIFKFH